MLLRSIGLDAEEKIVGLKKRNKIQNRCMKVLGEWKKVFHDLSMQSNLLNKSISEGIPIARVPGDAKIYLKEISNTPSNRLDLDALLETV